RAGLSERPALIGSGKVRVAGEENRAAGKWSVRARRAPIVLERPQLGVEWVLGRPEVVLIEPATTAATPPNEVVVEGVARPIGVGAGGGGGVAGHNAIAQDNGPMAPPGAEEADAAAALEGARRPGGVVADDRAANQLDRAGVGADLDAAAGRG